MSDDRLMDLIEGMAGAPSFSSGSYRFYLVDGYVITSRRLGKGDGGRFGRRWEIEPSKIVRVASFPTYWPLEVQRWLRRAVAMDWSAYLRAQAARVL